jgi:tripartite ATP-independent transporter DctM subunit
MTDPQIGMLMLFLFIFIIMLGFPIAFTLMAMGVGFGYYAYYTPGQDFFQNRIFTLLVQKAFEVMSSDVLTAVPLFLFMGYVVERANILDRLFHSLQISMKNVPGALAVATLLTCAMFATATGIVGAVVTLMGLLAFPAMLRAGYDVKLSAGVVCAGGCLGILIPPSILLIVYAATAGISAVKLYAAAFIPGFMLTAFYVIYVIARAMINPALAPKLPKEETDIPFGQVMWALLTSFFPLAMLIVCVLGAILFGLATPSEAAGVGALGGLVLAAAYRSLRFDLLRESVFLTARATAMVCYLFIGSWTFSSVFALLGGQGVVERFFLDLNLSQTGFLVLTQFLIFLLGWPLEWTEIIIIFVPIFLPLLDDFKVDPIFFGILIALNTQTAFNTPPVAMAAFYLKGVAPPHVKLTDIFAGALPFVFMVFATMILVYIFPGLALWLPEYLYTPR